MCGIFGISSKDKINKSELLQLAKLAQQRGKDSSGLIQFKKENYKIYRSDNSIMELAKEINLSDSKILLGHSRLITNGHSDNQPVVKENVYVLHNGIIVNCEELWAELSSTRENMIDTEILAALTLSNFKNLAAVIAIPERLTPGIRENICKKLFIIHSVS